VWGSGTLIRWLLHHRLVDLQSTPKGLTIQTYRTTGRPQYETATT
jgi:hypothetical protein